MSLSDIIYEALRQSRMKRLWKWRPALYECESCGEEYTSIDFIGKLCLLCHGKFIDKAEAIHDGDR